LFGLYSKVFQTLEVTSHMDLFLLFLREILRELRLLLC